MGGEDLEQTEKVYIQSENVDMCIPEYSIRLLHLHTDKI